MKFINRNNSGFTLIELMVALMILSILMGFAIPEVMHQIELSKKQTQKQNIREINKALQNFFADHGRYPRYSLNELTETTHPYFETIPVDPITGRADWLITNKSNYKTKDYFSQGEFGDIDVNKEGIYKVKAKR